MGVIRSLLEGIAIGFGVLAGVFLALFVATHVPYVEEFVKTSIEVLSEWAK